MGWIRTQTGKQKHWCVISQKQTKLYWKKNYLNKIEKYGEFNSIPQFSDATLCD